MNEKFPVAWCADCQRTFWMTPAEIGGGGVRGWLERHRSVGFWLIAPCSKGVS